jgi:chromosome partitioning protein
LISDLGLIPVGASGGNLWAIGEAKKLGLNAQAVNADLQLRTVANMNQNITLIHQIFKAVENDEDVPMCKTKLGLRGAYKEAEVTGATVLQLPSAKAAHQEIKALVDEVLQLLGE